MKIKKILAVTCACLIGLASVGIAEVSDVISDDFAAITAHAASSDVPIDATHFPDANFREYVKEFDTDGSNSFSPKEIAAVTEIDCSYSEIESLEGIENFTALTYLDCDGNQLTELDVSGCSALTDLKCDFNSLTNLDVSKNTALTDLDCKYNKLTTLDVSGCTALTDLNCGFNELIILGTSKNTALKSLDCSGNELSTLDVSKNTALEYLDCRYNELTTFNVSKNTELTDLYCTGNQLKELDVSNNTELTNLYCSGNLKELDVSNNTELTDLYCPGSQLKELDVSNNTELTYLDCSGNQLKELDVSNNYMLSYLSCRYNTIASLDISNNQLLTKAYVDTKIENCDDDGHYYDEYYYDYTLVSEDIINYRYGLFVDRTTKIISGIDRNFQVNVNATNFPDDNFRECVLNYDVDGDKKLSALEICDITYLGVSDCDISSLKGIENFKMLETLDCSYNNLTSLNLSGCTALTELHCYGSQLTELDVSGCTNLERLFCYNNQLSSLDVSKNIKLYNLDCEENQITSLDIRNNPKFITAYQKGEKGYEDNTIYYWYYDDEEDYFIEFRLDNSVKLITGIAEHTHNWDSGKVTKAATCTADGVKTFTCTECGETKTETIAKLGHSYKNTVVAPTYAAQGYTKHTCTRCGYVYKDNYKAKKTVKQVSAKTTYTCTSSAIRINWNKLSGVSGYRLYRYDSTKKTWVGFANIYDPNATNYRVSGLSAGTIYKFKVKAFVKENGKTYFGTASSTITTATKPKTTTITKSNKVATAVRLYWNKLACTGYRIDRYDSAQKKWVKVKAVGSSSTTQYRISGLKKNTTYKFRIVPYVKVGTKYIYGAASKTYTVKTTK